RAESPGSGYALLARAGLTDEAKALGCGDELAGGLEKLDRVVDRQYVHWIPRKRHRRSRLLALGARRNGASTPSGGVPMGVSQRSVDDHRVLHPRVDRADEEMRARRQRGRRDRLLAPRRNDV